MDADAARVVVGELESARIDVDSLVGCFVAEGLAPRREAFAASRWFQSRSVVGICGMRGIETLANGGGELLREPAFELNADARLDSGELVRSAAS